ncbi:hypothetical protein TIFTF001_051715 [Ficus carica]|uniref:Uncharacterized protein n=1 Tax=Ficus carica TaxID=3494 RepID=A0AA87ZCX3_FICCA|nr:hypothetical protein TIFTF001_051712 [Ficus carica]GMN29270.1 hypothetical protein TIFTF001_051713 [Ficus carica]GMN29280.1 hypothetical protein TIFTF001_051714 [Ficus carica]GMN29293.1 hypothetical protein TIFTF001_051715 [Ficus carica]
MEVATAVAEKGERVYSGGEATVWEKKREWKAAASPEIKREGKVTARSAGGRRR